MLGRTHPTKKSKVTPEEAGKMLLSLYDSGYFNHREAYKQSLIKGILAGFGGVIGATVVVGLLLWGLSFFHEVPFLNKISQNITQTIEQDK